jgi:hypothetical protein
MKHIVLAGLMSIAATVDVKPTPIPLTAEQNKAVNVASQNIAIADQGLQLRKAEFKALLGEIAHAQKANDDTHVMTLEQIGDGAYAFSVKTPMPTPTPRPRPTPEEKKEEKK